MGDTEGTLAKSCESRQHNSPEHYHDYFVNVSKGNFPSGHSSFIRFDCNVSVVHSIAIIDFTILTILAGIKYRQL